MKPYDFIRDPQHPKKWDPLRDIIKPWDLWYGDYTNGQNKTLIDMKNADPMGLSPPPARTENTKNTMIRDRHLRSQRGFSDRFFVL